jgi:predicted AAA+ superfamily ATPase
MMTKNHIKRTLETAIKQTNDTFKVLFLSGPRQVGKTTLLQDVQKKTRSYVTLDNLNERIAAQQDPANFIDRLQLPVLIDEVQYAPNLFSYIKIKVDQEKQPGLFWLTGSQQFEMMKNITESLAGRVAILNLQGISLAEEQNRRNSAPFIPELALLKSRQKKAKVLTSPVKYGVAPTLMWSCRMESIGNVSMPLMFPPIFNEIYRIISTSEMQQPFINSCKLQPHVQGN